MLQQSRVHNPSGWTINPILLYLHHVQNLFKHDNVAAIIRHPSSQMKHHEYFSAII